MGLQQRWRTELGPLGLSLELLIDRREVASALIDQSGAELGSDDSSGHWSLLVLQCLENSLDHSDLDIQYTLAGAADFHTHTRLVYGNRTTRLRRDQALV